MIKVYLCDKKKGACSAWDKYGWTECDSVVDCDHTSNPEHALCNGCDDSEFYDAVKSKCLHCPERKERAE